MGALLALLGDAELGLPMLLGGLSFLGADTSATEIGVRDGGTPRHVLTGKPMPRGESGGVTPVGLLASVGGAALAPLAWRALAPLPLETIGLVVFAGTAGALADSVLGVSLQWRGRDTATGKVTEARSTRTHRLERVRGLAWLDNDAVNLVGGILSALLAALLVVTSQR
jgi:uncharacterized membrane protein